MNPTRYPFDKLLSLRPIRWHKIFENLALLVSIYKKIILVVADGLTKELCIGAYLVAKQVIYLNNKSGPLFTALYLKQASVCLQQAYAGVKQPHSLLPVPVSLLRAGYPKIIPKFHRRMMMVKDDKADMLVRIYLSYFSLCRGLSALQRRLIALYCDCVLSYRQYIFLTEHIGEYLIECCQRRTDF